MIALNHRKTLFGLLFLFALAVGGSPMAESALSAQARQAKAAPAAENDADFAEFVKKATTKPEFLSPLVDHLPRKAGVPTPKDILGYHIGTEKKLTYVADQQRFFRALEKALPGRFKTEVVGQDRRRPRHHGRVHLVGSEPQEPRGQPAEHAEARRPARPDRRRRCSSSSPPPSRTTTSAPACTAARPTRPKRVMELAYRLAVSEEPYIKQIRDNVIVSITGDHRRRRPRSLRRLVLRLQDRRALRRRRELRRPALLGQVRLPRQQPRHQLRRRLAARAPQLVPELGAAHLARPARSADAALHLQRPAAAERQPRSDSLHASCRSSRTTR